MFGDIVVPTDSALIGQALVAAALALASVSILGAGMFVAYSARIFRKMRADDS